MALDAVNNIDNALRLVQIAVLAGSVTVNIWLWQRGRNDKALESLKAGDADLSRKLSELSVAAGQHQVALTARDAALEMRVAVLETTIRHMPTHGDLQAIQRELRDLNGTVAGLSERSETTLDLVRTIQEHLLETR